MMRRNDQVLGGAGLNPELLARINAASAVLNQKNSGNKLADKNAILKQLLESSGKKSSSKLSSSTSSNGYMLQLIYSFILLTGWLGSWTNGGSSDTQTTVTTRIPITTAEPLLSSKNWKYDCPFGQQGKYCDG